MGFELRNNNNHGFTLVELVVVILISGIVLATITPRFASTKAYDQAIIENRIISIGRVAQLAAFGRSSVALTVSSDGVTAVIQTSGLDQNALQEIRVSDFVLGAGVVTAIASNPCSTINSGNPLTITFNANAEIDESMGVQFCLNGVKRVCVSPAGFAHSGACE